MIPILQQRILHYEPKDKFKKWQFKRGKREYTIIIPDIEDRIIEMVICMVLEQENIWYYKKFLEKSFKGENAFYHYVSIYLKKYGRYVCQIDIERFFDSIDHSLFNDFLLEYILDKDLISLVKIILSIKGNNKGLIIGHPLSTYLADKFLYLIDKKISDKSVLRFVDNFLFFSSKKQECKYFFTLLSQLLKEINLSVNQEKSTIIYDPNIRNLLL